MSPARAAFEMGLLARLGLAVAFHAWMLNRGVRCLFGDANLYWYLASSLRWGGAFEVEQWGIVHHALRTPGYPGFLAGCQLLFGPSPLAARLVQALIAAACVPLTILLARLVLGPRLADQPLLSGEGRQRRWVGVTPAILAGGFVALDPLTAASAVVLLSESIFPTVMLLFLVAMAHLRSPNPLASPNPTSTRLPIRLWTALGAGIAAGVGVLIKPSWLLFPPLLALAWPFLTGGGMVNRRRAALQSFIMLAAAALTLVPWWIRNHQTLGRFVPTATWAGASLYDGVGPQANGASNLDFLNDPAWWPLDELRQDRALLDQSWRQIGEEPGRVAYLALIKAARFWSPAPQADELGSPLARLLCATTTLPILLLVGVGVVVLLCRGKLAELVLLAGPLGYFATLHLLFVGSMRYRIPAMVPAFILAAVAVHWLCGSGRRTGSSLPTHPKRELIPPRCPN